MNCPMQRGDKEIFIAYAAGDATPEQRVAFEQHLASCAECRRMSEAQNAVWAALDAWSPAPVSENFDARLYQRIAAGARRPWWMSWKPEVFSWRPAVPLAVACAALCGVFLINTPVFDSNSGRTRPGPSVTSQQKLEAEQVERALDDIDMLRQFASPDSRSL